MKEKYSEIHKIKMSDYINYSSDILTEEKILSQPFGIHWHDHYELEYFFSGSGYQVLNGIKFEIAPGSFHLLTPTDFHSIFPNDDMHMFKIYFEDTAINSTIFNMIAALPQNISIILKDEDKEMLDNTFKVFSLNKKIINNPEYLSIISRNILESCLVFLIDYYNRENNSDEKSRLNISDINRILTYIEKNFRKQITLNEVAEFVHFSPTYLSRYFHKTMGITFKEYIKNKRMTYAAKLILNSNHSITDICYEAGFASLSNFINEFKKIYSLSPSEYRRQNKDI